MFMAKGLELPNLTNVYMAKVLEWSNLTNVHGWTAGVNKFNYCVHG